MHADDQFALTEAQRSTCSLLDPGDPVVSDWQLRNLGPRSRPDEWLSRCDRDREILFGGRCPRRVWRAFALPPHRTAEHSGGALLCRAPGGSLPSEQEEVAPAKRATIGLKEPLKHSLEGISDAYTSKVNRAAMRTLCREQSRCAPTHSASPFGTLPAAGTTGFRIDGAA